MANPLSYGGAYEGDKISLLDPQDIFLRLSTGKSRARHGQDIGLYGGVLPQEAPWDEQLHAQVAKALTEQIGQYPTEALGYAKEGITGLKELATGGDFYSPSGFSREDIAANEAGIRAALRSGLPVLQASVLER